MGCIFGVVLTAIGMFFRNILKLECLVASIITLLVLYFKYDISFAYSLVITIVLFIIFYNLIRKSFLFWFFAVGMTYFWSNLITTFAYQKTNDIFLTIVVAVLSTLIVFYLHCKARKKYS